MKTQLENIEENASASSVHKTNENLNGKVDGKAQDE